MKKIVQKCVIGALVMCLGLQLPMNTYADSVKKVENANVYSGGRTAGMNATTWGMLISSIETEISNKGNGTVGIFADMLCHRPMERLRIWVYLQQWNEEAGDWYTIDIQKFTWLASDFPDEDLTVAAVSYDVPNLKRACEYRVQARFGANGIGSDGDDYSEAWLGESGEIYVD